MERSSGKRGQTSQDRIVRAPCNTKLLRALPGTFPGRNHRVVALSNVDQLGQRIGMGRVERRNRTHGDRMGGAVRSRLRR